VIVNNIILFINIIVGMDIFSNINTHISNIVNHILIMMIELFNMFCIFVLVDNLTPVTIGNMGYLLISSIVFHIIQYFINKTFVRKKIINNIFWLIVGMGLNISCFFNQIPQLILINLLLEYILVRYFDQLSGQHKNIGYLAIYVSKYISSYQSFSFLEHFQLISMMIMHLYIQWFDMDYKDQIKPLTTEELIRHNNMEYLTSYHIYWHLANQSHYKLSIIPIMVCVVMVFFGQKIMMIIDKNISGLDSKNVMSTKQIMFSMMVRLFAIVPFQTNYQYYTGLFYEMYHMLCCFPQTFELYTDDDKMVSNSLVNSRSNQFKIKYDNDKYIISSCSSEFKQLDM
jgi:hypothetical protein